MQKLQEFSRLITKGDTGYFISEHLEFYKNITETGLLHSHSSHFLISIQAQTIQGDSLTGSIFIKQNRLE